MAIASGMATETTHAARATHGGPEGDDPFMHDQSGKWDAGTSCRACAEAAGRCAARLSNGNWCTQLPLDTFDRRATTAYRDLSKCHHHSPKHDK